MVIAGYTQIPEQISIPSGIDIHGGADGGAAVLILNADPVHVIPIRFRAGIDCVEKGADVMVLDQPVQLMNHRDRVKPIGDIPRPGRLHTLSLCNEGINDLF